MLSCLAHLQHLIPWVHAVLHDLAAMRDLFYCSAPEIVRHKTDAHVARKKIVPNAFLNIHSNFCSLSKIFWFMQAYFTLEAVLETPYE